MKINLINFRDFSKFTKIKSKIFYRGPALLKDNLSNEDIYELNKIGFKHIIDFRSHDEVINQGELYYPMNANYHNLSAIVRNDRDKSDDLNTLGDNAKRMIEEWLIEVYRDLPFDNPSYEYLIKCVANKEVPLYINCSAGKDRTGVGALLIELLLGIDEEAIFRDYLESYHNYYNDYKAKGFKDEDIPRPGLCYKEWLEGTINEIKSRYGTYEKYFELEHHIDENKLKELREYYIGE